METLKVVVSLHQNQQPGCFRARKKICLVSFPYQSGGTRTWNFHTASRGPHVDPNSSRINRYRGSLYRHEFRNLHFRRQSMTRPTRQGRERGRELYR